MIRKKLSLLSVTLLLVLFAVAQAPASYYLSADGKSTKELKSALHNIIDDHKALSYGDLWDAFRKTDVSEDGKVWDMYSNCTFTFGSDQCGNYSKICDCYNREHSFPKSWFNDDSPMVTDLFHLYPTDGKVNGYRSNYPFGECKNGTVYGTGRLGNSTYPGYSSTVFEPADEYKGDFARTYFYMLTRYMDVCSSWSTPMMSGGNFSSWALNLLLEWNEKDPVSEKEIKRNNVIYTNYQKNRNPFIDYPELANKVYGTDSTPFDMDPTGIYENMDEVENVFAFDNVITVQMLPDTKADIYVFDIAGKKIKSMTAFENTPIQIAIDNGMGIYIVRIVTHTRSYSSKVVIK